MTPTDSSTVEQMRQARNRHLANAARNRRILAHSYGQPTDLIDTEQLRDCVLRWLAVGWRSESIALINGAGTATTIRNIVDGKYDRVNRRFEPLLTIPVTLAPPHTLPVRSFAPSQGATRRIRALYTLGWTLRLLNDQAGRELMHVAAGRYQSITVGDWRAVDDTYQRLSATPGPSSVTRSRSRSAGAVPPLGWDDIDDPAEQPSGAVDRTRPAHHLVDQTVVDRVLAGEWDLRAGRAEREVITAAWVARRRGSLAQLERLTGWRTDRYTRLVDRSAVAS